jgi:3-oxoacyl-[acyl-carrier-protein] synthase II
VRIAAEVKDFDPVALFGAKEARRHDRFALFALEAARQAIADAGLSLNREDREAIGVLIGTGIGGALTFLENHNVLNSAGPRRVSPFMIPMMMPNAASAVIAITYGLRGPNLCVASACATGAHAIGEAASIIRRGDAEVMICGGSEAVIHPLAVAGFARMGALSTHNDEPQRASRPFDAGRDGFVLGEGAGVLVLESLEHALARGARIYCELAGYGASWATRTTSPRRRRPGREPRWPCGAPWPTRASRRRRWTTSTPTAPAPPSTTGLRLRPSAPSSVLTPTVWPSVPPSL